MAENSDDQIFKSSAFSCHICDRIITEIESKNWNFQMYRHNAPRTHPSLYTKYYRTL